MYSGGVVELSALSNHSWVDSLRGSASMHLYWLCFYGVMWYRMLKHLDNSSLYGWEFFFPCWWSFIFPCLMRYRMLEHSNLSCMFTWEFIFPFSGVSLFVSAVAYLWFSLVILFSATFLWKILLEVVFENALLFFMVVCLWWFEEVYMWYLFRYSLWCAAHFFTDVCSWWLKKWMYGISLLLFFVWPQFVLAKNLPKGEVVGYLCIGFIIAKANTHGWCWIQCALMYARFILFKEFTPYFLLTK